MDKKTRTGKGNFLIITGLLLIVAAFCLIAYNIWESYRAGQESETILSEMTEEISPDNGDTLEIDGSEYIGIITIPSLNIELPVMSEWDYTRLRISPCRYSGTYSTNDMVICGHNYASHFSPIKHIDIGVDVYFTTVKGEKLHYIVSNRQTVKPTAVSEMIENDNNSDSSADWDLTLFTCNTGGQTRCAVRCIEEKETLTP